MKTTVRLNTFETNSSSMHSFTVTNIQKTDPTRWEKHHIKDYTKDIVDQSIYYNYFSFDYYNDGQPFYIVYDLEDLSFLRRPLKYLRTLEGKCAYAIAQLCTGAPDNEYDWNDIRHRMKDEEYNNSIIQGIVDIIKKHNVYFEGFSLPDARATEVDDMCGCHLDDYLFCQYLDKKVEELTKQKEKLEKKFFRINPHNTKTWHKVYDELIDVQHNIDRYACEELIPFYGYCGSYDALKNFLKDANITLEEFLCNPEIQVIVDGDEYCDFKDMIYNGLIDPNVKIYTY